MMKAPASSPTCVQPGCGKPTWNENANQYRGEGCEEDLQEAMIAVFKTCDINGDSTIT